MSQVDCKGQRLVSGDRCVFVNSVAHPELNGLFVTYSRPLPQGEIVEIRGEYVRIAAGAPVALVNTQSDTFASPTRNIQKVSAGEPDPITYSQQSEVSA